ncbi:uncharacterized protein [Euwallacea similis]|uniref:uncharacterized protein n=1 Tax=Euwallacea similis TaxID=1736056 RepID=UPI00344B5C19
MERRTSMIYQSNYNHKMVNILHFVLVFYAIQVALAIVCPPDFCDGVECRTDLKCAEKQVKRKAFCACCDICYTILDEGENCSYRYLGLSVPPPARECGKGLRCVNNVCIPESTDVI